MDKVKEKTKTRRWIPEEKTLTKYSIISYKKFSKKMDYV